jgi:hypothetical protein
VRFFTQGALAARAAWALGFSELPGKNPSRRCPSAAMAGSTTIHAFRAAFHKNSAALVKARTKGKQEIADWPFLAFLSTSF